MAPHLDQDVIQIILHFLWNLHSTSWDSEFRPEHFRHFFIHYSLISSQWTLPAQRYIYRSAYLHWNDHVSSFEAGLNSRLRGQQLFNSVRVLDVSISNSQLGIPSRKLSKLLRATPYLVELRLRVGTEVSTLFARKRQAQRLRTAFTALHPTLRAFQVEFTGHYTRTRVLEELFTLIELSSLEFVTIAITTERSVYVPEKLFAESEWTTYTEEYTTINWPIETNAHSLSMKRVLFTPPASSERLVKPEVLRVNAQYMSSDLVKVFGSHLKEVVCQPSWQRDTWSEYFDHLFEASPHLERLILIQIEDGKWSKRKKQAPVTRLHVIEQEDWMADDEAAWSQAVGERGESDEDIKQKLLRRASHVVTFNEEPPESWTKKNKVTTTYRRPEVFDERWLGHAMTGIEEGREPQEIYGSYSWKWELSQANYRRYFFALRKPREPLLSP